MSYVVVATVNAQGVTDPAAVTLENVRDALPGVGLAGLQEVANLRGRWSLRQHLSRRLLGVYQDTSSMARAGCALVWDRSRVSLLRRYPLKVGVVVRPGSGVEMLTRWLVAADFCIDSRMFVTGITAHRPPFRYRHLWPAFDKQLRALIDEARYPVVLFTDNNSPQLGPIVDQVLTPYARGIDMIALGEGLHPHRRPGGGNPQAFYLPATRSDHRPVALELAVDTAHRPRRRGGEVSRVDS